MISCLVSLVCGVNDTGVAGNFINFVDNRAVCNVSNASSSRKFKEFDISLYSSTNDLDKPGTSGIPHKTTMKSLTAAPTHRQTVKAPHTMGVKRLHALHTMGEATKLSPFSRNTSTHTTSTTHIKSESHTQIRINTHKTIRIL